MKKGLKISLAIFIILAIALPTTFLIYQDAYKKIEFELHDIILDDVTENKLFKITVSYEIDLRLNLTIKSPTGIPLSVDGGTFKIEFDNVNVGDGVFGAFTAIKEPSPFIIETNLTIGITLWQSIVNLVLGNDVIVRFTILTVTIYGNEIQLNRVKEDTINLEDFI